jgi:hypothetical protein
VVGHGCDDPGVAGNVRDNFSIALSLQTTSSFESTTL